MNPLAVIGAIRTGVKIYRKVRPIIRSIRGARRSSPRSSSMVLSPDGNPMYHHTMVRKGHTYQTAEYRGDNNVIH